VTPRAGLVLSAALLAAGLTAWRWPARTPVAQPRPWAAVDGQVGSFWNCLFGREVAVADLENGQQARRLGEAAYSRDKQAYPRQLVELCLPRLQKARGSLEAAPATPALARYRAQLTAVEEAVRLYAQRLAVRQATKELDDGIVAHAGAWYADATDAPRSVAYQRFLTCAVPELDRLPDDPALYRHLADRCFAADPLPFMRRIRAACAPLLHEARPPAAGYARTRRKFRGAGTVQVSSWESCSDIARAEERLGDGVELVRAADAYLAYLREGRGNT
jgi:hypothetical protein